MTAKLVIGLRHQPRSPESLTDYTAATRASRNATAFATHVRAYNLWWAQNIPYFDLARTGDQEELSTTAGG